ncbi:MAG TPA: DUF503 domain-containing protein [Symbiobacteriaceae bacterium]|nr:DUF503 domain-containing protein [Symbiobacteriaceae bacterium]
MLIAAIELHLSIPEAHSLKEKRMVILSIMDRIRAKFGAAVAEVGEQEVWQRTVIGVALVGNEEAFLRQVADKVIHFTESHFEGEVCEIHLEIL